MNRFPTLCILFLCFVTAFAQNPDAASAAFHAHEWDKAATEYQKITTADPKNGEAWYQLGMSLYSMDKFQEAAAAFQHSAELKFRAVFSTYNTAAALARAGQTVGALAWLEKAARHGIPERAAGGTRSGFHFYQGIKSFPGSTGGAQEERNSLRERGFEPPI